MRLVLSLLLLFMLPPGAAKARTALTADTTVYVDNVSGQDVASCGTASSSSACKTPAYAMRLIENTLDLAGYNITLKLTAGQTYTASSGSAVIPIGNTIGDGNLIVDGSETATVQSCSGCAMDAIDDVTPHVQSIIIQNIRLESPGQCGIYAQEPGVIYVGSGVYISNSKYQICAGDSGAIMELVGPVHLSDDADIAIMVSNSAELWCNGCTINISGNPKYIYFIDVFALGEYWESPAATINGTAVGMRYNVWGNGGMFTNSGNDNHFPGTIAGAVSLGGTSN